jgi:hypothetical protein
VNRETRFPIVPLSTRRAASFAEELGGHLLQPVDGRVLEVGVVADLGRL